MYENIVLQAFSKSWYFFLKNHWFKQNEIKRMKILCFTDIQ